MNLSDATLRFIREHLHDDLNLLALQAHKHPEVDIRAALTQLAGRQVAAVKLPRWAAVEDVLYPSRLAMEQCSSDATAAYKASVVAGRTGQGRFADLTGGLGVDCAALAAHFPQATYVERQEELCALAVHNFPLLGVGHVQVHWADCTTFLQQMPPVDWIFIDPARRDAHGGKTVSVDRCEPDVAQLEESLLSKADRVLVKLSPMLDLSLALHELHRVVAAHVVSVDNECKELLLVLDREASMPADDVPVCCVNLGTRPSVPLVFTRNEERQAVCLYASEPGLYLYEPNASLLKAGAFRSVAFMYKVRKLHPNSHLYTSDTPVAGFPGRTFRLAGYCDFHKKGISRLLGGERRANLAVRNFPAMVAQLRRQLKLAEGGGRYLFATTLADGRKVLLAGERVLL